MGMKRGQGRDEDYANEKKVKKKKKHHGRQHKGKSTSVSRKRHPSTDMRG
jgi:hypothetical protein